MSVCCLARPRYFAEYLALEWVSQYLLFWSDVDDYRMQFGEIKKSNSAKMPLVARNIYNKYCQPHPNDHANVWSTLRNQPLPYPWESLPPSWRVR